MNDGWAPIVGDRVYIATDRQVGQVILVDSDGDSEIYVVEMDIVADSGPGQSSRAWGHDERERLTCTIDELSAD